MMTRKTYTLEEAKKRLEYYCSYQERCHQEVDKRLNEMNMIPTAKEVIIVHLIENNYLNEERFAKTFARGKFRIKKWGKRRIANELKMRDISDFNIKMAMKEINEAEYMNVFNKISNKKFTELKEANKYKKRKKLADYLLYRGWDSDMVYKKTLELIP